MSRAHGHNIHGSLLDFTQDLALGKRGLRDYKAALSSLCGEHVRADDLVSCLVENSTEAGVLLTFMDTLSKRHTVVFISEYPRVLLEPVMNSLGMSSKSAGWRVEYSTEKNGEDFV